MSGKYLHRTCVLNTHFILHAWAQNSQIHSEVWILEFLGFSSGENKKNRKGKRKQELIIKKKWKEIYSKSTGSPKEKSRSQVWTWTVFVLQEKFFLRENIIDQTYRLDEKVAAVLPGTVRYICGALKDGKYFKLHWMNTNKCWHLFDFLTINMCFLL